MIRILALGILALNLSAALRAGAATSDITPPVGAPLAGYFVNRASTAVHDPLLARALVLETDGTMLVLITCDLTNMPQGIADQARAKIAERLKISPFNVMVTASHTHTAPVILSGWSRYALEGEMQRIAMEYAASLPLRIAASAEQASAKLRPARLSASIGQERSLAFYRRFRMKDGTIGWNPGKLNTNIVEPVGQIDPAVPLVYVEGEDGQAIAAYVNYAVHLDTVGGTEMSADFVYSLSEALKVARGSQIVTLFSMGTSGNINHIDTTVGRSQKGHREAARLGTTLAAAVLKAAEELVPIMSPRLSAKSERVTLDSVVPTAPEFAEAQAMDGRSGATVPLAKRARTLEIKSREGKPFLAEVQVLRAGADLVWVGLPGEIFVELGVDLKKRAPCRFTVIATQSNAALGYVPHREAYPQGNYEVVSARVAAGSGEKLVDTALRMINER
ncbi:MAG: hypothetical protein FJW36_18655 [Acidobacteria bacterium]|nr:hypothetical protein [Acidobacteriota bacterium]